LTTGNPVDHGIYVYFYFYVIVFLVFLTPDRGRNASKARPRASRESHATQIPRSRGTRPITGSKPSF